MSEWRRRRPAQSADSRSESLAATPSRANFGRAAVLGGRKVKAAAFVAVVSAKAICNLSVSCETLFSREERVDRVGFSAYSSRL